MRVQAKDIAAFLGGIVEGDSQVWVERPAKIEEGTAGAICFLANPKYEAYLYTTQASVVLVGQDFQPNQAFSPTLIRVADVYGAVSRLLEYFQNQQQVATPETETDSLAFVHPTAQIGSGVRIGAFAFIGENAVIGEGCTISPQAYIGRGVQVGHHSFIYPGVRILADCSLGERCIIHANAVIGSDGFGFAPEADGSYRKIPQLGIVEIGNDVEIGANTTIDRATMGKTIIADGAKLDNLIQVAHNTSIGRHTAIAAQAGIAGSVKIGEQCLIGGQAGIAGHLQIADNVRIQAQSGVNASITEKGKAVYGSPILGYRDYLRSYALFKNLPEIMSRLEDLEKKLNSKSPH